MLSHAYKARIINLSIIGFICLLFWFAHFTTSTNPEIAVALVLGIGMTFLSFARQDIAAITLIVAMMLSPEFKLAGLPKRDIVLRFDDVLLVTFFMTWMFKAAYYKQLNLLKFTSLNKPMLMYITVAIISTWKAVAIGDVQLFSSAFYLLKYIEYFMVYFMFSNIITDENQLKKFMTAFFITAMILAMYGIYQILTGVPRITTPFEGKTGEANTFGGYIIVIIGILAMGVIKAPTLALKTGFIAAVLVFFTVLLFTYSRSSYLGILVLFFATPLVVARRQKMVVVLLLMIGLLCSPLLLPQKVKQRVLAPFQGETEEVAPFLRLNPGDSSYLKVQATQNVIAFWKESPIIGRGVTGVGLVDTQYPLILGETGILGVVCYFWLFLTIVGSCFKARKYLEGKTGPLIWFWRTVVNGFLCSLAGLLFHAFGANTFIILRIMEPFLFLTAVIVSIPTVLEKEEHSLVNAPAATVASTV